MPPTARLPLVLSTLLPLSLACLGAFAPPSARAQAPQLNRCIGPGGGTIYTDRRCEEIGSSDRLPRGMPAATTGRRRSGCARNLQDLIFEVTTAIDNHDANRLGSVYHWVGQNQASGDRILDRLQAVVDRPLVDIAVLRSAAPVAAETSPLPLPPADAPSAPPPAASGTDTPAPAGVETAAPSPRPRSGIVGLRLEQTLLNSATPSRTVFGLRRNLDCWWITF